VDADLLVHFPVIQMTVGLLYLVADCSLSAIELCCSIGIGPFKPLLLLLLVPPLLLPISILLCHIHTSAVMHRMDSANDRHLQ
jgi:hypothetical protein